MKYYCVEIEDCGFYKHIDSDIDSEPIELCPDCYSMILIYEDHETPIWLEEDDSRTEIS